MEIYIANVGELKEEKVFCALQGKITEERRRRIEKCRRQEDKIRGLGAGLLLEYGLNRLGLSLLPGNRYEQAVLETGENGKTHLPGEGYEQVFLETGENGKPYLRGREEVCFNLSHSGDYAAAVFASSAVGIDIEEIRQDGEKIVKRFFREEEQRYLTEARWENCRKKKFTELWTRKESYMKAVGGGMKIPMDSFSVLGDRVISDFDEGQQNEFFLRTYDTPEGYCLSVCGKMPIEAEPERISFYAFDGTGEKQYNKYL